MPSARSGPSSGGGSDGGSAGGGRTPGASPPSKRTLLGEAEEVLVKSWQAYGSANPAVLELVELQNPLPSPGRGGGAAAAGGEVDGGMLLHRYVTRPGGGGLHAWGMVVLSTVTRRRLSLLDFLHFARHTIGQPVGHRRRSLVAV